MTSDLSGVRFRYQTIELGEFDYHLRTLRDLQQCPAGLLNTGHTGVSSATWPLFGVLWQSERLLSELMVSHDIRGLRILEVGCGTGLASIVLRRRGANITATDYNPDTAACLDRNTALNHLEPITCICSDWHQPDPQLGRFDLIIGSDLLYDHHNVKPLVSFLQAHARLNSTIVIVDPRRGLTGPFTRQVRNLGFSASVTQISYPCSGDDAEQFLILKFRRPPEQTESI